MGALFHVATILEALDMEFQLPKEEWMRGRIDEWWEKI